MGRKLRIDGNGLCHHVIIKGINDSYIFKKKIAKDKYIELLRKYIEKHDVKLFAYCIMDNHVHLLIQSGASKGVDKSGKRRLCLSDFMHDLQAGFARWYNKINKRTGAVFNGRYKNFTCYTRAYFYYVVDYIHKNPVKHKKTKTCNYSFSSFREFHGQTGICDLEALSEFLETSLDDVLLELDMRKNKKSCPFLKKLIKSVKEKKNANLEKVFLQEKFLYHEFLTIKSEQYFKQARINVIHILKNSWQLSVKKIAERFNVSASYIYKQLKFPADLISQ